jgi:hypothetical protein
MALGLIAINAACAAKKSDDSENPKTSNESQQVADGGATSGGGELVADAHNPWFLSNNQRVNYCIDAGEDFSWDKDATKVDLAFQSAVSYWNQKIDLVKPYQKHRLGDGSRIELGGKKFLRITCDSSPDIVLALGQLDPKQSKIITEPRRFPAVTVRTSYDEVQLKGSGFIYIAPDRGPRAFEGENIVENAWTLGDRNNLLRLAFIHELGHIFGLQHNQVDSSSIMSAKFVERILNKDRYEHYLTIDNPDFILQDYKDPGSLMNSGFSFCSLKGLSAPIFEFFKIDANEVHCLRFDPFRDDEEGNKFYGFQIWQGRPDEPYVNHLGFLGAERFDESKMQSSNQILSEIYLTSRQKVLPISLKTPQSIPLLESVVFKFNGALIEFYGEEKQSLSLLSIEPDRIKVSAAIGDKLYEDIFGSYSFHLKKIIKN